MRRALSSLLRSVANLLNPPSTSGDDARVSPEQLRKTIADMLRDPAQRMLFFPGIYVQGGVTCTTTPEQVGPGGAFPGSSCGSGSNDYSFPGKLGIGTTTPDTKLEVNGAVYTNAEGGGIVVDAADYKRVGFMKYSGIETAFVRYSGTSLRFGRTSEIDVTAGTSGNFTLEMVITGSGTVGIGTASPSSLLHVVGSQPGTVTAATQVLQITGGKGGNTTTSGQTGGAGAAVNITAGAGGNGGTGSNNGDGGSIILQPGAAGTGGTAGTGKSGSVIIGGTAYKQISGGPELISAQGANQDNVVLWCGLTTDTNARFLFSYRGFLEWGDGGSADQDIALFRSGGKGIAIQNFTSTEPDKAFAINLASASGADESPEVFAVDTKNKMVRVTASKLTVKGCSSYDATGTVSTANNQATVTGSGTSFRTQVRIGDRIKIVTTGEIKTVTAIASDTSLTVDSTFGAPNNPSTMTVMLTASGTVTVNDSSNAVTGSGTSFTKQVGLGDRITVSGHSGTFTVISIASDTSLTVDSNFTSNLSGKIMSILPGIFRADDSAGNAKVFVSDQGNVGIGTTKPAAKVQIAGGDVYISDVGKGIILKSPDGTKCARISLNNNGTSLDITTLTCP